MKNKEVSIDTALWELEKFFERMSLLPATKVLTPNLFSLAGPGCNENRLSDLMALFMGGHPGAPHWLGKALITCLFREGAFGADAPDDFLDSIDWNSLVAEREVGAWDAEGETTKRLDIVLSGDDFVVGVEHKVWAPASNNPFHTYARLLDSYGAFTQAKCVLRPDSYSVDVSSSEWLVVSYGELLAVAYELFGHDAARGSYDKWQVFYFELLKHMESIASPNEVKTMERKELDFSLKYFSKLFEARNYLERLESELIQEGKGKVGATLETSEEEVKVSTSTWGKERVLRFSLHHWKSGTQVCLVYYPDVSGSEADETVGFYVRAYVSGYNGLDEIRARFMSSVPIDKCDNMSFYRDGGEKDSWYENNKRYLGLDTWPREYTRAGAMEALAGLTKWLDERLKEQDHLAEFADNH